MHYHLVGIKGSSMSGLAKILESEGHKVTGSDLDTHDPKNITKDIDQVVISAAITPQSKGYIEVEVASQLKIPIISRSKLIGKLMLDKYGIAIAGMHGKSTVTAMVGLILEKARLDPTVLIGAETKEYGNVRIGKGKYFVVEACEYERQFLDFRPKAAIITNLDEEHLDTYQRGMPEIISAFKKFVDLLPKNGILIGNLDDKNQVRVLKSAKCKVKTVSSSKIWPGLKLKILGSFNLLNATAAARLCHELGVEHKIIKEALNNFTGLKRRLEIKGEVRGILVMDDYGHHPTEIKKTLEALKQFYSKRRLIVVYQAHQYLRTKLLFSDFAKAFDLADEVILADIYAVPGRDEKREIESSDLEKEINKNNPTPKAKYLGSDETILDYLFKNSKSGDIILTMGATRIFQVGEKFLKELKKG